MSETARSDLTGCDAHSRVRLLLSGEFAVMAAVQRVNNHAEDQPTHEANPRNHRKSSHEPAAKNDRNQREPRHKWYPETSLSLWLCPAQHDYAQRKEHEREQRSYIGKIGGVTDRKNSRWETDRKSSNPGRPVWRLEARMNTREDLWEQSVPRHRVPDAGLPVLKHQQRRDHSR